jgi:hypothetical protein
MWILLLPITHRFLLLWNKICSSRSHHKGKSLTRLLNDLLDWFASTMSCFEMVPQKQRGAIGFTGCMLKCSDKLERVQWDTKASVRIAGSVTLDRRDRLFRRELPDTDILYHP